MAGRATAAHLTESGIIKVTLSRQLSTTPQVSRLSRSQVLKVQRPPGSPGFQFVGFDNYINNQLQKYVLISFIGDLATLTTTYFCLFFWALHVRFLSFLGLFF